MGSWQAILASSIAAAVPGDSSVRVHGSVLDPTALDGWSDLDLIVNLTAPVPAAHLFGAEPWAFEDSTLVDRSQRLRAVLPDGRRVDAVVFGERVSTGMPAPDNGIRFSAAIAAARFGRRSNVLGLQRLLLVVEACLQETADAAAGAAGSTHQRFGGPLDARVTELMVILRSVPDPRVVVAVREMYGRWRSANDPAYQPDWSGLQAVLATGASAA